MHLKTFRTCVHLILYHMRSVHAIKYQHSITSFTGLYNYDPRFYWWAELRGRVRMNVVHITNRWRQLWRVVAATQRPLVNKIIASHITKLNRWLQSFGRHLCVRTYDQFW